MAGAGTATGGKGQSGCRTSPNWNGGSPPRWNGSARAWTVWLHSARRRSAASSGRRCPVADSALRAQLEEEKSLTAQLQERLRAAKEREAKGDLQDKVDRLTQQLDVQGLELQRMRRRRRQLARTACGASRRAGRRA